MSIAFLRCVALFVLVGCLPGCSTYTIQQTALVPAALTPPTPARDPGAELVALGSYVTGAREHDSLKDSSLWVARGYGMGTFEYAFAGAGLRATWFYAPSEGALRGPGDTLPNPGSYVAGGGLGVTFRVLRDSPIQRLHVALDSALVSAPSYVRSTCLTDCEFDEVAGDYVDRSIAFMHTASLHYRREVYPQLQVVGTLAFQTLVRNDEHVAGQSLAGRSSVNMGAVHPLINVGVEYDLTPWLSISPLVGFIAPPSPMLYLPSASILLRAHFSDDMRESDDDDGDYEVELE